MTILDAMFAHPRGLAGRLGRAMMARLGRQRNQWLISLLDVQGKDHILEVGFGPGTVIQSLATLARDGFVAGVDTSPLMLREASRLNEQAIREGRVQLQEGSVLALPFEEGKFDKALSINSVQIWPDSAAGVREMRRVLKPGGLIALALQPIWVRTDDEVRKIGEDLLKLLATTSFQQTRLEYKSMKPKACVCALGIK